MRRPIIRRVPESLIQVAVVVFAVAATIAVAFQVALALGAPWGAYAMGGAVQGRFPPRLRVAAVVQGALILGFAIVVAGRGGVISVGPVRDLPWLVWLVVAFSTLSLVLNAASRSPGERKIWVPVALAMLASSLVVALGGG
jgi:hypothetical protein